MNITKQINLKDGNTLEILEAPLTDDIAEDGIVGGYWKCEKQGHAIQLEPYFYMPAGGMVKVTTKVTGPIRVSINFFNDTMNHGGPRLPKEGGTASIGPGQWHIYFTGSFTPIKNHGIDISVRFDDRDERGEVIEPEDHIEETDTAVFKARAKGSSRPQAIRIAYRRADSHAAGKPYKVIEERVYAEGNAWVCILTCQMS